MSRDTLRLAVLIDADNVDASMADALFDEIARYGEATVRRIYGDFSGTRMKGWRQLLARHAINPTQQFPYTRGKNASDITMVIEAMDLLHTAPVDGFCLVSSDSDFTRLASRIREAGLIVYGFGEKKTPEAFVLACTRFFYLEVLKGSAETEEKAPEEAEEDAEEPEAVHPPSKAVPRILKAMRQIEDRDGWYALEDLAQILPKLYPDWDPRRFGQGKLDELVAKSGGFRSRRTEAGRIEIARKQSRG